mgnify:CR=1 FL=1
MKLSSMMLILAAFIAGVGATLSIFGVPAKHTSHQFLLLDQKSDVSLNVYSFIEESLVRSRGPYAECQTRSCPAINEGEFSLDVENEEAEFSVLFTRHLPGRDGMRAKSAMPENGCIETDANDLVRFKSRKETANTVTIVLQKN